MFAWCCEKSDNSDSEWSVVQNQADKPRTRAADAASEWGRGRPSIAQPSPVVPKSAAGATLTFETSLGLQDVVLKRRPQGREVVLREVVLKAPGGALQPFVLRAPVAMVVRDGRGEELDTTDVAGMDCKDILKELKRITAKSPNGRPRGVQSSPVVVKSAAGETITFETSMGVQEVVLKRQPQGLEYQEVVLREVELKAPGGALGSLVLRAPASIVVRDGHGEELDTTDVAGMDFKDILKELKRITAKAPTPSSSSE